MSLMAKEMRVRPATDGATLIRAYMAAVERFDAAAVEPLLHEDMVQTEHPNLLVPRGRQRRKAEMLADLKRATTVLRRQSFAIASLVAEKNRVALEARWEGEMAVPLKTLRAGDRLAAQIAILFRIESGQILRQANYDCFEPF